MEAKPSGFAVADDAFLAVLVKKTDLLNAAKEIERGLQEELTKEKESHVVDVQNVTTHVAADIKKLKKEKE